MRPILYATDHLIGTVTNGVSLLLLSVEAWSDRIFLRICADETTIPPPSATETTAGASVVVSAFHGLAVILTADDGSDLPLFYRQVGGTGLEWTSSWGFQLPHPSQPREIILEFRHQGQPLSSLSLPLHPQPAPSSRSRGT